ncbi:hypothetical protein STEG23_013018 [Scotinomys teguina]
MTAWLVTAELRDNGQGSPQGMMASVIESKDEQNKLLHHSMAPTVVVASPMFSYSVIPQAFNNSVVQECSTHSSPFLDCGLELMFKETMASTLVVSLINAVPDEDWSRLKVSTDVKCRERHVALMSQRCPRDTS